MADSDPWAGGSWWTSPEGLAWRLENAEAEIQALRAEVARLRDPPPEGVSHLQIRTVPPWWA